MGEVELSSDELEMRVESETEKEEVGEDEGKTDSCGIEKKKNKNKKKKKSKGESPSRIIRWERFLPKMMLRVLLVEADDSTRQIIAALLRKCSYRVAAVSDGLKAWEILKGRAHNIDLILTEVDLPSISGFALLTLITEHEVCKKIPVIMMSKQDSISTVYKCMLRGAADYLVKPIRRNELRNLWQHVWRRQSANVGINNPREDSVVQDKEEATSENNAASNRPSSQMTRGLRNNGQIEKRSDSQSSCTNPELEAESAPMGNMQEFSQPKWGKFSPSDRISQEDEACVHLDQKLCMHEREAGGPVIDTCKDDSKTTLGKDVRQESQRMDANISDEACNNNYVLFNPSRETTDYIGAFHNYLSGSSKGTCEFGGLPQLDLSLERSHPSGLWNQHTEERRTLGHSNSSAFKRYTNRLLQLPQTTVTNASDTPGITQSTQRSIVTLATGQSKESEVATSCSQQRVFPVPVPVKRINSPCKGFSSVLSPIFCSQSGPSQIPSPGPFAQEETSVRMNMFYQSNLGNSNFEQPYDPLGQNTNNGANQTLRKLENKLDALDDQGKISPVNNDQSGSSSICNGGVSHHNSIGYGSTCGSNNNADHVVFVKAASESKSEEGFFTLNSSRSIQREAALTKFRLKRKERCYEKKVRYESRKKLAEQRPRVKGQFVRHVNSHPPPVETDGDSFDG
ncbi:Two-component response regulator-like PRR95 [Morella rubra]|uniref:Two-component response regulator-like PRR95 n=1 Tax=Morella rubra TaxID=262757 RepID=A0A6A1UXR7_9ROSI|nr:Two-component response regulator-like PRR95 [Morella rubra]